ncbi:MAG: hypothetical protein EOP62_13220 [Sphingomonadales bacterium]|nr:MAG: hypothetical protein EOP62_13220 [Sphingomonadales bacterium]
MNKPKFNDIVPAAAAPALIGASLVNFLVYQNYPVFRWEIALIGLAIIAVCAVVWFIYLWSPRLIKAFMEAGLLIYFIGYNIDIIPSKMLAILVIAGALFYFKISILRKLAVFGFVVLLTSLLGFGGSMPLMEEKNSGQAVALRNLPPVLHIILDEHIGTAGLRSEGPDSKLLADEISQAYLQRGFSIYDKAYSRHFRTTYAIPDQLEVADPANFKAGAKAPRTMWLDGLVAQGYALKVYQSDYVDYCAAAKTVTCTTYGASALGSSLAYPMTVVERAQLVAWGFGMLAPAVKLALAVANRGYEVVSSAPKHSAQILEPHDSAAPMAAAAGLEILARDLRTAKPGEAFFAHLLMPHFPYVFDAKCDVRPLSTWRRNASAGPVSERQLAYNGQARCTLNRVMKLVDELSARTGGRFIAVIQGDHGSRILSFNPTLEARKQQTKADLIASYSTLFAIHLPGGEASVSTEAKPVSELLREFRVSGFASLPTKTARTRPKVWLPDINYLPVVAADMPPDW